MIVRSSTAVTSALIAIRGVLIMAIANLVPLVAHATFFDDVGYSDLVAELGGSVPTGTGIPVSQIEAEQEGNYLPNEANDEFSGKDIDPKSGSSGVSTHANGMAQRFFGNTISTAPGVTQIDLWEADHWLDSGFLKTGTVQTPLVETQRVQNHSWVGSMGNDGQDSNAMHRLDFVIERDGIVASVGMDNGSSTVLPKLLGQSFNTISVGKTDGEHSHGFTTLVGSGRIKPEIVAPSNTTSRATARVSAAAAILLEQAAGSPANNPRTIKAVLMAGATKDEFNGEWDRTTERPLDEIFGVGELNVYRSYQILEAGKQSSSDASLVGTQGWDFDQTVDGSQTYFFEVPGGHKLTELSVVLTWHRDVIDTNAGSGFNPLGLPIKNLELYLHAADGFDLQNELDSSLSAVDNVEHIYLNENLGMGTGLRPGQFALEVASSVANISYSLAWMSDLTLVVGDMDLNGLVDFDDIQPFVLALIGSSGYLEIYGVAASAHGDTDGDGDLDFDDIEGFIGALSFSRITADSSRSIPEPSTLALAAVFLCLNGAWKLWRSHHG